MLKASHGTIDDRYKDIIDTSPSRVQYCCSSTSKTFLTSGQGEEEAPHVVEGAVHLVGRHGP